MHLAMRQLTRIRIAPLEFNLAIAMKPAIELLATTKSEERAKMQGLRNSGMLFLKQSIWQESSSQTCEIEPTISPLTGLLHLYLPRTYQRTAQSMPRHLVQFETQCRGCTAAFRSTRNLFLHTLGCYVLMAPLAM